MSWFLLLMAGIFEVGWAVGLKYTHGFTRFWPSVGTVFCMIVSMALLGLAIRHLPLGSAYAIWTGIGTIGTVVCGMLLFGESASALRLGCVALIVVGITGLKMSAH